MLGRFLFSTAFVLVYYSATPAAASSYCAGGDVEKHAEFAKRTQRLTGTFSSACTMFIARSCVYRNGRDGRPRTLFKFHSAMPARYTTDGRLVVRYDAVPDPDMWANKLMLGHYPPKLRDYIIQAGCFAQTGFPNRCVLDGNRLISLGATPC